jgi:hypothetical protein
MVRTYQIILDKQRARRLSAHLRNMGMTFCASECGEQICIQLDCKDSEIKDIRACLDEVNRYYNIKIEENENEREAF